MQTKGKISIVGIGPGDLGQMTDYARRALEEAEAVVGYETYIELIRPILAGKEIITAGMTEEVYRARQSVKLAREGRRIAIVSSGDAGLYGMAGLIYEVLIEEGWRPGDNPEVESAPGVSAMFAAASLLGAPIIHDVCSVSLSDHLTPWNVIAERLEAAAKADFVIALYNPKSGRRKTQIEEAVKILLKYRSPETPVGIVKAAYRQNQEVIVTTLAGTLGHSIGMLSIVIIGNSSTFVLDSKMITPRGYQKKYNLGQDDQMPRSQRMHAKNEPWALSQLSAGHSQDEKKRQIRGVAESALFRIAVRKKKGNGGFLAEPPAELSPSGQHEYFIRSKLSPNRFSSKQLATLAALISSDGEVELSAGGIIVKTSLGLNEARDLINAESTGGETRLDLRPLKETSNGRYKPAFITTCTFCDMQKPQAAFYLEELENTLGQMDFTRPVRIGLNGCGMSCFGALKEDIGIVYYQGRFEIYAGAKTSGRKFISPALIYDLQEGADMITKVKQLVADYAAGALPKERFYSYWQRITAERNMDSPGVK